MKKLLIAIAALSFITVACKTSEENYRAAYEKTVNSDENSSELADRYSNIKPTTFAVVGTDTIPLTVMRVTAIAPDGQPTPVMGPYSVVVGRYRQRFNAFSVVDMLKDKGYNDAFAVVSTEPYYYVVAASSASVSDAARAMTEVKKSTPVVLNPPMPFILNDPRLK